MENIRIGSLLIGILSIQSDRMSVLLSVHLIVPFYSYFYYLFVKTFCIHFNVRICYRGFHKKGTHSYLCPQGKIDSRH